MVINKKSPHGGDIYERPGVLDFSANINPYGPPEKVREAMRDSIERANDYPDPYCRKLREKTALSKGVPEDLVLFGNGAAELIYQFAYALPKGKAALIVSPTFCEYEAALRAAGVYARHFLLPSGNGFVPDEMWIGELVKRISKSRSAEETVSKDGITQKRLDKNGITGENIVQRGVPENVIPEGEIGAVFLCSPNNPTGIMLPPESLKRIADTGVRVFCDLSFMDFSDKKEFYDIPALIKAYSNLVFLFSFTKSFAIPGIRLGYAVCSDRDFLERMSEKAQCWNVSVIAQAAGIAALDCGEWLEESVEKIKAEREYLFMELGDCGLKIYESCANFLLLYSEKNLVRALAEKGIQVRDCSDYAGLSEGFFRTAVRKREENERLIRAVREILAEGAV